MNTITMRTFGSHRRTSFVGGFVTILAMGLILAFAVAANAGVVTKHTAGTDVGLTSAWGSGSGPLPATGDVATWSGSSLGGTLTNSIAQTWGAIDVEGASAAIIMRGQPLTLSGGQTVQGVASSGLYLAAAGQDLTITNNITNSAAMTWTVGAGRTMTVNGGVLNLGANTLTLAGSGTNFVGDTYTGSGNIVVNGPTYVLNSSGSGRSGTTTLTSGVIGIFNNGTALGTGALYLNGGTLGSFSTAGRTILNSVFIGGDVTFGYSTGTLSFTNGIDLGGANRTLTINAPTTFSTQPVANGGIIATGTNGLTLSTANTFSGGLTVQAGTVNLSSPSAAGTGTVTLGVAGDATSGTLNLSAGTRNIYGLATAGTAANQIIGTANTSGSTITLNYIGATTNTFGGVIEDAFPGGNGTIGVTINNTNAILTLSGANTYTGPTTVTNGTLFVTGSLASTTNTVTVAGGTLGGTGTIGGPTTVTTNGTLTVGGSTGTTMGTLAFGTNLSLSGNTILRLKKGGSPSSDSITSGGALTFGGTLTLSSVGATLAANDSFTIFSAGGTGVFTSFSPATPGTGLVWDTSSLNSSGIIKVAALAATITAPAVFPAAVTNTYGTASSPTSVAVTGSNLTGNITANAPAGFEVSSDNITYGSTATFVQSGGSASGTLYLRIAATSLVSGSYNSKNVVLSSSGASTVNVATTASGNAVFAKALTVASASVSKRLFDGTTAASIVSTLQTAEAIGAGSSSDGKPYTGDTLTVSGTGTFPTPAAGGPYTVTPSTFTLGGSSATNYSLTQPTGLSLSASILNTAVWTQLAGGSWTNGANWLNNIKATGADNTADFSTLSLTADTTVTLDGSNTVGHLRFDDQGVNKYAWTLNTGSKGPLTLAVSSGSPVISNNVAATIGAVIAGTNGLTKTGNWPLILVNSNTYSGGTEISAGTLQLDTGVTNIATAGTGAIQIDANGTLQFNYGADAVITNNLTGTGTIVENGLTTGGAVVLTGTNSFSGQVQINVNKVAFSSSTSGNGAPKIAISAGGTMSLGSGYAGGTLTISELSGSGVVDPKYGATPSGNRTLNINQSSTTTYSGLLIDGGSRYLAITKSGTGTLIISGSGNAYSGPTTVSNGTLEVDGTIGYGPTLTYGPVAVNGGTLDGSGTIYGPVTLNSGTLTPATASGIGTLTINNTLNINGGTVAMRISKTGGSTTSDNLAGLTSVTYGGTLTVTNITSDAHLLAAGDTFTLFSGSGSGGFSTYNLPTLPAGLSWDLSGLTVNGSIAVTANLAPIVFNPTSGGYVGALPVTMTSESGATIHYTTDGSDPTTSGTVVSAASPASVTIPVNTVSRTLRAYATKSGKPNTSVSSATYSTVATPTWITPADGSWSTTGNWSNSVVANNVGVTADFSKLTLSADTIVTLDTPATVGDLTFADQGNAFNWILAAAGNPLTLNAGTNTPIINVVNKTTTIGAVVAGSSGLIKSGTGTLTLTGNNTYSGGTEISAGTLQIANGTGSTATAGTGSIQIDANGTLIFNFGATQDSFGNNLTGTGTIVQNGPNELGLTGVNSFSGLIQINTNNVAFAGANSGNGQPRIAIGSNGLLKLGAGFIGGTLTISELSGAGAINEALTTTSGTRTLNINQGSTTTFSGVMSDSTLSRYLAVIKSGTGTLVLSGPNTYTGATTVSNGTLEVDGQIANSQVTVNGGTLDGSGTIYGPVTLNSGKLAPATAAGIGTLTINNTLTINGGTVAMRISKTGGAVTNDLVAGLNNVTYGGSLVVTNAGPSALAGGEIFQLFSASGSKTGNFTNVTILPVTGATGTFDPATGTLTIVAAASAPTPTNITYTVTGSQLVLNWPAGQGWQLQSQTNSLSTGLTTNWTTVSGATPPFTNTITPANPSVFYRLRAP